MAAARKLDPARLDRAARGRVFTGTQARAAGLVDEIGGLERAIALAKGKAGIDAGREVNVRRYPAEKEPAERLFEFVFGGGKPPKIAVSIDATRALPDGQTVTVSCAEGDTGNVYAGELAFEVTSSERGELPDIPIKISMNIGNPQLAFGFAQLPNAGVGLARLEFIINNEIGVHPRACLEFD